MKSNLLIAIVVLFFSIAVFGQKRAIDNNAYKNWESLGKYEISNDGEFIWYEHRKPNSFDIILVSVNKKHKRIFSRSNGNASFTDDGKNIIIEFAGDSIGVFNLKKMTMGFRQPAESYKLLSYDRQQFLVYQTKDTLTVSNLKSGYEHKVFGIMDYNVVNESPIISLKTKAGLSCLDIATFKIQEVYKGKVLCSQFSGKTNQVVFLSANDGGKPGLYISRLGLAPKLMVNDFSAGIENGFALAEQPVQFSSDGNLIYFKLKRSHKNVEKDSTLTGASVDIWNWQDQFLMSRQLETLKESSGKLFTAVLNIRTGKIIQLENSDKEMVRDGNRLANQYVLVKTVISEDKVYYKNGQFPNYQLVSLIGGEVLSLRLPFDKYVDLSFSPSEKFILWSAANGDKYTYEISTGITRNLTEQTDLPRDIFYMANAGKDSLCLNEISYWLADDFILAKDKFDYWLLDPTGSKSPTCITAGYGRMKNVQFELAISLEDRELLRTGDGLFLRCQDLFSQENGFSIANIDWKPKLKEISLMKCRYGEFPVMPKNKKLGFGKFNYLLTRETVESSPNLVITKDFKTFEEMSDIHPERHYNWLTSEIMHWNMLDGKPGIGILYKPENFYRNKKYPVIFWYYQEETWYKSNRYLLPELCNGDLNIPWYVSNGYLVFSVDISNYVPGKIAVNTVNSIVSAAKYLSQFPWVDSTEMGIQGHSFGGYETNLLVANTNLFAAASSAAGLSNVISLSGSLSFRGKSGVDFTDLGQTNLGSNPWTRPDVFIENSPVFKVDKITTPLLLQNNKKDDAVPFLQGVEMFTAMRRAGKRVWLLQYDDQGHGLSGNAALDYTIRQQQFFDHYLKGKPMPVWMSRGVPAKDKGIRSGLEYDLEEKGSESGL